MVSVGWPRPLVTKLEPSHKKQVRHIVGAMVGVDHRRLRIVAHAAGPQQMHPEAGFRHGIAPLFCAPAASRISIERSAGTWQTSDRRDGLCRSRASPEGPSRPSACRRARCCCSPAAATCVCPMSDMLRVKYFASAFLYSASPLRRVAAAALRRQTNGIDLEARVDAAAAIEAVLGIDLVEIHE